MLGCNVYKPETYVYLVDHALSKKLKTIKLCTAKCVCRKK